MSVCMLACLRAELLGAWIWFIDFAEGMFWNGLLLVCYSLLLRVLFKYRPSLPFLYALTRIQREGGSVFDFLNWLRVAGVCGARGMAEYIVNMLLELLWPHVLRVHGFMLDNTQRTSSSSSASPITCLLLACRHHHQMGAWFHFEDYLQSGIWIVYKKSTLLTEESYLHPFHVCKRRRKVTDRQRRGLKEVKLLNFWTIISFHSSVLWDWFFISIFFHFQCPPFSSSMSLLLAGWLTVYPSICPSIFLCLSVCQSAMDGGTNKFVPKSL